MQFSSFFETFPDLVMSELRNIFVLEGMYQHIPEGNYGFIEFFCDAPDCDCRNVMIHIMSVEPVPKLWAIVRYGWESKKFYRDWMGGEERSEFTENLRDSFIDTMISPNDLVAQEFLFIFKNMIKDDKKYAKRIETHYRMYKDVIEKEKKPQPYQLSGEKVGRNDPCHCGSGLKYKKCCLH